MLTKVAVVTGANKGIGYAIVKSLCEKFDGKVYLTSRDENRGQEAIRNLKKLGLNPLFYQLDITVQESINKFRDYIKENEEGIDVLVNNAAIAFKGDSTETDEVQAKLTIATNYVGTLNLCEALFPLLRPNAQVVNVSSALGHLSFVPSSDLKSKLSNPTLTVEELSQLMNQFISDIRDNVHIEKGWGNNKYGMSKVAICALTTIHQRELDQESEKRNVSVNSVHPGYVDTDMSSHKGTFTVEEGARVPLFLALGGHGLKGQLVWHDSSVVDWHASQIPKPF